MALLVPFWVHHAYDRDLSRSLTTGHGGSPGVGRKEGLLFLKKKKQKDLARFSPEPRGVAQA